VAFVPGASLAGRVARPRLPVGEVRIGGCGGPEALAAWLREHEIAAVIDATHPFAERISTSAARAGEQTGVPLLRLERPGWTEGPEDRWHRVKDLDQAAKRVPGLGSRALLTTGRQGLSTFAGVRDTWFLIRCVDPPDDPLPPRREVLLDRGPYTSKASSRSSTTTTSTWSSPRTAAATTPAPSSTPPVLASCPWSSCAGHHARR